MDSASNTTKLGYGRRLNVISSHTRRAIISSVERCAFVLFFLGASTVTSYPPLVEIGLLPNIPYYNLLMCLPGAIIGAFYWCTRRGLANSYPVLLAMAFVLFGMLIVDPTERGRSMIVAASILCVLAAGAWIEAKRQWIWCAVAFVAGTIIAGAVVVNGYEGSMMGQIHNAAGTAIGNRNDFAMQFVFSTLLIVAIVSSYVGRSAIPGVLLGVAVALCSIFTLLVILSESRSAFICLEVCVPLAIVGNLSRARLITSVAFVAMSVLLMTVLSMSGHEPVVIQRFSDDTVSTAGGRVDIFVRSMELLQSRRNLFIGAGTAGVDKQLGTLSVFGSEQPGNGIARESSHNMFLEWFLSYGILGVPAGIWLLGSLVFKSFSRDKEDSETWRSSVMLFVVLSGLVSPFYVAMNACGVLALVLTMPAHDGDPSPPSLPSSTT